MLFRMDLFIFSRSIAILTSLLNNSAGLAARSQWRSVAVRRFFIADCKGMAKRHLL
nr:MAG TPA: hypothetical protein [Caudoviricetes sp.]